MKKAAGTASPMRRSRRSNPGKKKREKQKQREREKGKKSLLKFLYKTLKSIDRELDKIFRCTNNVF